ncbi:MAG: hypothetical protein KAV87_66205 [Desulfobacteraceae bacterium]|nr:hypothetical protein [Desulfobacteraceae bacterium]
MTETYYQEFSELMVIKLDIIQEVRGTITKANLHIESTRGGIHDLKLLRPRVSSEAQTSLSELFDDLSVEQVDSIKVFGEPFEFGETSAEIRWRIEIWRSDDVIDSIRCREILGLPKRA